VYERRLVAILLLLFSLIGVSAPAQESAAGFYEDALLRFQSDDYKGAIVQLKNALQADPENLPSRILLGRAYLRLGAAAAAEVELRAARARGADLDLIAVPLGRAYLLERRFEHLFDEISPVGRSQPVQAEIYLILGQAYLQTRDLDQAQQAFLRSAALRPTDAAPLLGQAVVALRRARYSDARTLADEASKRAPDSAEIWYLKGEIQRLRRDPAGAVEFFDRALEREPGHLAARNSRAGALLELGQDEAARRDVDFVLAAVPEDPKAAYLNAALLARAGDLGASRSALEQAARTIGGLDPDYVLNHGPSLLIAGVIKYAQGNYNESYAYLNRYVAAYPHQPGARKLLGDILLRRGELQRAIEILKPATAEAPDDAALLGLLGTAYMRAGRYSDATAAFEAAATRSPEDAAIQMRLAQNRLAAGDEQAAIDHLNAALSLNPQAARPGLMLGFIELSRGDSEAALEAALAAAAKQPANPLAHNLSGAAYAQRGQWPEARASFERAVALDPGYTTAQLNLATVEIRAGLADEAAARYRALLEAHPDDARVMMALASLARSRGHMDEATQWLEKVRAAEPDAVAAQVALVEIYLDAGKIQLALEVAQRAEERAPENLAVLEAVGMTQVALGQRAKARVTFSRMSRYAVYSADWLQRIAAHQARIGDSDGARWSLQKALAATPDHLASQVALVKLDARGGDIDGALRLAAKVREQRPESAAGDVLVGDVYAEAGRNADALKAYRAGWKKQQTSGLAVRLFRARSKAGDPAGALAALERWLAEHDDDAAARRVLASAYARTGRTELAILEYEKLVAAEPRDAGLANNLAALYLKAGDERALALARKAYALAPDNPAVADTLGWILINGGQLEDGLVYLREAHSRASNQPEVRYHLAVALNGLGRTREARSHLQSALEARKDFEGVADARRLLESMPES